VLHFRLAAAPKWGAENAQATGVGAPDAARDTRMMGERNGLFTIAGGAPPDHDCLFRPTRLHY
jgi:hypothetical protein